MKRIQQTRFKSLLKEDIELNLILKEYKDCRQIQLQVFQLQNWEEYELVINNKLIQSNHAYHPFKIMGIQTLYSYLDQNLGNIAFDINTKMISFHLNCRVRHDKYITAEFALLTKKIENTEFELLKSRLNVSSKIFEQHFTQLRRNEQKQTKLKLWQRFLITFLVAVFFIGVICHMSSDQAQQFKKARSIIS